MRSLFTFGWGDVLVELGADDGVAEAAEGRCGFGYGIFEGAYLGGHGVVAVGVAYAQALKLAAICLIKIILLEVLRH